MSERRVAVIGGGAAGMMAAIISAQNGDDVTVFEKNAKIGRKLYITGKGRCNLTNNCDIRTVVANTPTNGRFLFSALNRFSPEDTITFFEENGLPLKTERGNRVFPVSDKAADVVDTLLRAARSSGCRIKNIVVDDIAVENGCIKGIQAGNRLYEYDKVIIACGGVSYPLTGSTGDGYRFAQKAGHTIVTPKPSLVPLETIERPKPEADKLLLKNIALTVTDTISGKTIFTDFGELHLMRYGFSGAVVLSASSHMRDMQMGRYRLDIDLKPALSEKKLDTRLLREFSERRDKSLEYVLRALMPGDMLSTFICRTDIPAQKCVSEITKTERRSIVELFKCFSFTVKGFRPIEEAIVTSGGVCVKEIDPKTMESLLVKGLYFAGEVIDYDCYTGGFNLQCAFATGAAAGEG